MEAIYLYSKDCGEIEKFDSLASMLGDVETIDVENDEFYAWDSAGHPLELFLNDEGTICVRTREKQPFSLNDAFLRFSEMAHVDISNIPPDQYGRMYDQIRRKGTHRSFLERIISKLRRETETKRE